MNNTSSTLGYFSIRMEAGVIPALALDIVLATISIHAVNMILGYLKSKPPGMQSPIDQVNTYLLRSLQCLSLTLMSLYILIDCTLGVGETLAKILMWPFFMSGEIFFMFLIINTVCYQLLSVYPHLIETDFNRPMAICLAFCLVCQTAICAAFQSQGVLPPNYYALRRIYVRKTDTLMVYRRVSKAAGLTLLVILRLVLWFRQKHRHNDLKVISDKSLLLALVFMVGNSLISNFWLGLNRHTLEKIAGLIIIIGWPINTCLFNQNVRSYAKEQIASDMIYCYEKWATFASNVKRQKRRLQSYLGLTNTVHTLQV